LQEELNRAYKLCKRAAKGKACWSDVYALPNIANKNKHYMRLEFVAQSKEALELLVEWGEVCLPMMLTRFESDLPNLQVRAWSQHVLVKHESYAFACSMFIGLRFPHPEAGDKHQVDLRIPVVNFLEMMDRWPYKEHFKGQYDTKLQHVRRQELQQWWETYVGDESLEQKHLSDSQSDENMDRNGSQGLPQQHMLSSSRWSDSIDDYTDMCVECY